jgi:hypothetical protein
MAVEEIWRRSSVGSGPTREPARPGALPPRIPGPRRGRKPRQLRRTLKDRTTFVGADLILAAGGTYRGRSQWRKLRGSGAAAGTPPLCKMISVAWAKGVACECDEIRRTTWRSSGEVRPHQADTNRRSIALRVVWTAFVVRSVGRGSARPAVSGGSGGGSRRARRWRRKDELWQRRCRGRGVRRPRDWWCDRRLGRRRKRGARCGNGLTQSSASFSARFHRNFCHFIDGCG